MGVGSLIQDTGCCVGSWDLTFTWLSLSGFDGYGLPPLRRPEDPHNGSLSTDRIQGRYPGSRGRRTVLDGSQCLRKGKPGGRR